jgi:hypothetical protein
MPKTRLGFGLLSKASFRLIVFYSDSIRAKF